MAVPWQVKACRQKENGFPEDDAAVVAEIQAFYDGCRTCRTKATTARSPTFWPPIEGREPLLVDGGQGRRTLELITAIYQSGHLGCRVKLPLGKDEPFYTRDGILSRVRHFHEKTRSVENFASNEITLGGTWDARIMAHQKSDGMNYAPKGKTKAVCSPGEFRFAAVGLDHGHIYGQCNGLIEAGGELAMVFDPDPAKVEQFCRTYPCVKAGAVGGGGVGGPVDPSRRQRLRPCDRGPLGLAVMDHGKDYFTDKPPFTTLDQLDAAQRKVAETGRIFAVYYAERLHVEAAVYAGQLIEQGAVGRVVQVIGLGPHRLNAATRPAWFWDPAKYGGILR